MTCHFEILNPDRICNSSEQALPDDLRQLVNFYIAKDRLRNLIMKQIADNAVLTDTA